MKRSARKISSFSNARIALVTLAVLIPLVFLGFTKTIPFKPSYEISAVFESSNNLKKGSPVRIAGVEVGKVTKLTPVAKGSPAVKVTMRVGKAGRPIHDDARAKIRPRIFLEGNFFVDLEPGTPGSAEIKDNGTIPINQTAVPVQFDQLLTSLQSDTREDLKTLLDEYGKGLDKGGAEAFNRSIPYWKSAYRDTAIVNEATLGEMPHDLSNYVKSAGTVGAALDRNSGQLKSLITDFNTTANAFAVEQGNLSSAIAELPHTLRAGEAALGSLNAAFPPLRQFTARPAPWRALVRPRAGRFDPAGGASCAAWSPRTSCAASPPTCARPSPRWRACPARASRCPTRTACSRAARTRSSCRGARTRSATSSSRPRAPSTARRPRRSRASPARAARVTRTASGSACSRQGGTNLVTLAPGVYSTTANPIIGANPPKSPRPVLDQSHPCETQEAPDLNSDPGKPPEQHTVDTKSQAFQDRYALAKGRAVDWLKQQLKIDGLQKQLSVNDKDATPGLLDGLTGGKLP